ncbi:MAG TPA: histidine kinase, partial [Methanoregulaceae archaeon]|nr:histidine kinase [Methanoregulaceae archaeon]
MPVILLLVVISILLEIVLHWYLGISVAFSHFFYIPVVLAAVWYGKRAVLVAIILGIAHLAGTYFSIGFIDTVALLRAMMFIVIALVLGA